MYAYVAITVVLSFTRPSKLLISFSMSVYFWCFAFSSSVKSLNLQTKIPGSVKQSSFSNENLNQISFREKDVVLNCCPPAEALVELWISMLWSTSLHGISDSSVIKGKWPRFELPPSLPLIARKPFFKPTEQQFSSTPSPSNTTSDSDNFPVHCI